MLSMSYGASLNNSHIISHFYLVLVGCSRWNAVCHLKLLYITLIEYISVLQLTDSSRL